MGERRLRSVAFLALARSPVDRGVPIATEKKQRSSRELMFRWLAERPAGGSGDMDNNILGTSLACAVGVAAAFRADLRARERAMRQDAELSWGPNGHELRVVLPRLSLLAWCAPAADGAVLRNAPTHRPRKWSGSSWSRARAGSWGSEHPTSLWNSPGRCTVPSMSRHDLVTTLCTRSRLRRWFASTRPINCGIAARCDAAHKKSPLEPRVRAGSGSTQATDEAALSHRIDTGRRPGGG